MPPALEYDRAAAAISEATALLIGAGAGMGVDSGLPDFRGDQGFWNAYPPYQHLGVSFIDMANPRWFTRDPAFAWGFYGHRRNLYRDTVPHAGFTLLRAWAEECDQGAFVFTSNVDNQFQKAGFLDAQVDECHGALEWNQCVADCGQPIFAAGPERLEIDETSMRAADPLPACPRCDGLARPNILMFGDFGWDPAREKDQTRRLQQWLERIGEGPIALIEMGAGRGIPTVRSFMEQVVRHHPRATLIRINPREPEVPSGQVSLPVGAQAALQEIAARR